MITINVDSFVNGYGVKFYDKNDGYILNEFHEEKIDALRALELAINEQIIGELEKKISATRMGA